MNELYDESTISRVDDIISAEFDVIEHKTSEGYTELIFDCPFCGGDARGPCFHLNLQKGLGHCWRENKCGWRGDIRMFLNQHFGYDISRIDQILEIEERSELDRLLINIDKGAKSHKERTVYEEQSFVSGVVKLGSHNIDQYPDVANMLADRRYEPSKFLTQHDVYIHPKGSASAYFEGRIIFVIRTGRNYTWLAYAISREAKVKTINNKASSMSKYLYNYEHAKHKKTVFLVEGIFDCARIVSFENPNWSAVSLLGTTLSSAEDSDDDRFDLLANMAAEEIVVCLDKDAMKPAWKMYHKLKEALPTKSISIIDLASVSKRHEDLDPDECDRDRFEEAYRQRYTSNRGYKDLQSLLRPL